MEEKTQKRVSKRTTTFLIENTQDVITEDNSEDTWDTSIYKTSNSLNIYRQIIEDIYLAIKSYTDGEYINIMEFVTHRNLTQFLRK